METLIRFLAGLLPPHNASPEKHFMYLQRLGLTVSSLTLATLLIFCLLLGIVPHMDQFAHVSDLSTFSTKLTQIDLKNEANINKIAAAVTLQTNRLDLVTTQSIEQTINEKLRIACSTDEKDYKAELYGDIQQLEDRYYRLTGQGYRQPTCDQVP